VNFHKSDKKITSLHCLVKRFLSENALLRNRVKRLYSDWYQLLLSQCVTLTLSRSKTKRRSQFDIILCEVQSQCILHVMTRSSATSHLGQVQQLTALHRVNDAKW